jgi:hypothetical protein
MKLGFFPLLALPLVLIASSGCENIALLGRPPLEPDELVGEVERIDTSTMKIHVRSDGARTKLVGYNANTRVLYRGQEYPVSHLEPGDLVMIALKEDSRGDSYTELIHVRENVRDRAGRDRPSVDKSTPSGGIQTGIQTLDGTVEYIDRERGLFEIRPSSGEPVIVSLPYNARQSEIDRLERLRAGDRVRVEGRYITRDRFELETFL